MAYVEHVYNALISSTGGTRKVARIRDFLLESGLLPDSDADFTVVLAEHDDNDEKILATGSLVGNVIKFVAVSSDVRGAGACATIISELVTHAYHQHIHKLFLFTKPDNEQLFLSLGFYTLAKSSGSLMMENDRNGINSYLNMLQSESAEFCYSKNTGAVVANCNPMTNGHLYLMENAARECDVLHVFILSEDKSMFPTEVRYKIVKAATAHITNMCLHRSSQYIVSQATFPTYFIKDASKAGNINADLDLELFATRIAPTLGIIARFVGTEPFCPVTRAYNERMKVILPKHGILVKELQRIGQISASKVRELIDVKDFESLRKIVPQASYDYIIEHYEV